PVRGGQGLRLSGPPQRQPESHPGPRAGSVSNPTVGILAMNTIRYFLARYVPNLDRGEPRNIGVLVWSPDGVAARFLAESPDRPGVVDEAHTPAFVRNPEAY